MLTQERKQLVKSFYQLGREAIGQDFRPNEMVNEFAKTFSSGGSVNPTLAGAGDAGAALRLENLDPIMTTVLYDESDIKIFPWIEREVSTQAMFMYNKRLSYGGGGRGKAGFAEGNTPVGGTATYERDIAQIRYMGTRRGTTHQFTTMSEAGGTQLDIIDEENRNGTMALMEMIERATLWGDARILDDSGTVVHYDGVIRQLLASPFAVSNVLDLRDSINPDVFNFIGTQLRQEGKLHSSGFAKMCAFMPPTSKATLSQELYSTQRVVVQQTSGTANPNPYSQLGTMIDGMTTNFGYLRFEDSILMERVDTSLPVNSFSASGDAGAPVAPASATATAAAVAGGRVSKFAKALTATYWVSAFNNYGESLSVASAATVIAGANAQEVNIVMPATVGAWGYRIYRSDTDGLATSAGIIDEIPAALSGNTTFHDDNVWLPNTDTIVMIERDKRDLSIVQLMPLIKFPLAVVSTKQEFLLMLYHTVLLKAAQRMFMIKNVTRPTLTTY